MCPPITFQQPCFFSFDNIHNIQHTRASQSFRKNSLHQPHSRASRILSRTQFASTAYSGISLRDHSSHRPHIRAVSFFKEIRTTILLVPLRKKEKENVGPFSNPASSSRHAHQPTSRPSGTTKQSHRLSPNLRRQTRYSPTLHTHLRYPS